MLAKFHDLELADGTRECVLAIRWTRRGLPTFYRIGGAGSFDRDLERIDSVDWICDHGEIEVGV